MKIDSLIYMSLSDEQIKNISLCYDRIVTKTAEILKKHQMEMIPNLGVLESRLKDYSSVETHYFGIDKKAKITCLSVEACDLEEQEATIISNLNLIEKYFSYNTKDNIRFWSSNFILSIVASCHTRFEIEDSDYANGIKTEYIDMFVEC